MTVEPLGGGYWSCTWGKGKKCFILLCYFYHLLRHLQLWEEINKTKINENNFYLMVCQVMTASKWSLLLHFRDTPVSDK